MINYLYIGEPWQAAFDYVANLGRPLSIMSANLWQVAQ